MPGQSNIGDYTTAEIAAMDPQAFKDAQARGFKREPEMGPNYTPKWEKDRPAAAGESLGSSVPKQVPQSSSNVWASKQSGGQDFTCPSGQTCRVRPIPPEELLTAGILDRVTRLEGLADSLVQQAEGAPPVNKLPSREDFELLLSTINVIVPLAVLEPKVWTDDAEAPEGSIRVSDIDLADRMAIMEFALRGLRSLDSFRNPR